MAKEYRKLTADEIVQLKKQGCRASDWNCIEVSEGFLAANICNTIFGGKIRLGSNDKVITNADGVERNAGIYNAEIINCSVGDNVFISNVGSYICSYDIADDVYIESTGKIVCTGKCRFGNGVEVLPVNEGGGREVPIFDKLTAQTAYMIAMYRHRPEFIARIKAIIDSYCQSIDPTRGRIDKGARITGSNTLRDIHVGQYAHINGVSILTNGTVISHKESPTYMGSGIKAHDFICAIGSCVDNGAALNRCFIGEACKIDYGYTVTDSLFFANCDCANGEACSIFAGPYTVSHHKSSLLIAGYFSFFNAGSGANQSNHLFKTGAVHQGIHERGCKFASNAYVMLPAREGAFTVILGRHTNHHNTADFPYSYLVEEESKTYVIPGINLKSYGTLRDIEKWRKRDRRGPIRNDRINFDEHNPYIGSKLLRALVLTRKMFSKKGVDIYNHNRLRIKAVMLKMGMQLYELALEACLGHILENHQGTDVTADPHWVDMAGMYAPKQLVNELLDKIEKGELNDIDTINNNIISIDDAYSHNAHAWAILALGNMLGREPSQADIDQAVSKGRIAAETINKMRQEDSVKDCDGLMKEGYGIDCNDLNEIDKDFRAVRNF